MSDVVHLLVEAFAELTHTIPADALMFGSPSLQLAGVHDGTRGVQWNTWIEWDAGQQMAYAGVNLEGMAYDGWPVARLIERELEASWVLPARGDVADPARIEVLWYRDAWQVQARPAIREKLIGGSPRLLHTLTADEWRAMLLEAYDCLDPSRGHRGRAQQALTTSSGERRTFAVSPHLQFRQRFWPRHPATLAGWRGSLDDAMSNLRPLHTVATRQARSAPRSA
jgi:hypothetical protein